MKRIGLAFVGVILLASLVKALNLTSGECPVVGSNNTRVFYLPGAEYYDQLTHTKKYREQRVCFKSESAAITAGYRRSLR